MTSLVEADNFTRYTKHNMRGFIIPKDGTRFVSGDYNAIEARVVGWLAGDITMMNDFADFDKGIGEEPYKLMASAVFNIDTVDVDKYQRFVGKSAVLGCGFQMGAPRFETQYEVQKELAETCVKTYRSRYRKVPSMWYAQEEAAIEATLTGKAVRCGKLKWFISKGFLYCLLPSGRPLAYYNPHITVDEKFNKEGLVYYGVRQKDNGPKVWGEVRTYGGKLVENITQAVARDLMANALINLEKAGFDLVASIHDEALAEDSNADERLSEFTEIMETVPAWAEGLPVRVSAETSDRYGKE
jgi:DNA polymerase